MTPSSPGIPRLHQDRPSTPTSCFGWGLSGPRGLLGKWEQTCCNKTKLETRAHTSHLPALSAGTIGGDNRWIPERGLGRARPGYFPPARRWVHILMEATVCTEAPWSQPATALTQAGHFCVVTLQFPVQVWGEGMTTLCFLWLHRHKGLSVSLT